MSRICRLVATRHPASCRNVKDGLLVFHLEQVGTEGRQDGDGAMGMIADTDRWLTGLPLMLASNARSLTLSSLLSSIHSPVSTRVKSLLELTPIADRTTKMQIAMQTTPTEVSLAGLGFNLHISNNDSKHGLAGLGLGLPSSADRRASTSSALLFPMPSASRKGSMASDVLAVDGLISYWSPLTDDGEEFPRGDSDFEDEEQPEEEHATEDRLEWNQPSLSPFTLSRSPAASVASLQEQPFAPHPCLHLLSPKLDNFSKAAAAQGITNEDALSAALDWAWIMPMIDTTSAELVEDALKERPQAPAMLNLPSIASLASQVSLNSSLDEPVPSVIASLPYENDMMRSHSLHSCFSKSSFSTAASSVASTSASVMDRKHPLAATKPASSNGEPVVKLRSTQPRRAIRVGDQSRPSGVTRSKSKMSVVSQRASVHMASPLSVDLDCMVFEPMQQLPSPTIYSTELAGFIQDHNHDLCTCEGHAADNGGDSARQELYELWSAAEEVERHRKLQKQRPRKHLQVVTREVTSNDRNSQRVRTWVTRMKRTASTTGLGMRQPDGRLNAISDPLAWASQESIITPAAETTLEACFEPRQPETPEAYLDQLLCERSDSHQTCAEQRRPQPLRAAASGCIWDFLG